MFQTTNQLWYFAKEAGFGMLTGGPPRPPKMKPRQPAELSASPSENFFRAPIHKAEQTHSSNYWC